MKTYKGKIKKLQPWQIAVIGTNPQGIHGAGAAKWARFNAGLAVGHSRGICGNTYGIVTKDLEKDTHPSVSVDEIYKQLLQLEVFACQNQDLEFIVFYSGTGYNLNGYTPQEMAKIFSYIEWPENVIFEETFYKLMKK